MIIATKAKTQIDKGRGHKKTKPSPLRQCALTKRTLPMEELIRFVLSPEQVVTPDLRCKLPGRGLWLCADRKTVEAGIKKKIFARGFSQKALASHDLADIIHGLARIEALHTLSLANKAGLVITGYEKIKRALVKRDMKWILHATEASHNGSDKLDRYFTPPENELTQTEEPEDQQRHSGIIAALFTGDELSLALGRSNVIHIGLKPGAITRRFTFAVQKTKAFEEHQPTGVLTDQSQT